MFERYILDIFAVIFLIFAPWWIFASAILAGAFIFRSYYELLILSCLYDLIYAHGSGGISYTLSATMSGGAVFVIMLLFKNNFNLHEKKVARHW